MLDTAEYIAEEKRARGTRQITISDPIVLPDGSLPQAYIVESMAQISGIASGRKGQSLFAGITGLTFYDTVRAGETLEVESTLERNLGGIFMFNARASASGKNIAEGGIVLHFNENTGG